jgi:hypothetical protein
VSKKEADERLQELRNKNHNKIRYRKRLQEEEEFDEYLKDALARLNEEK